MYICEEDGANKNKRFLIAKSDHRRLSRLKRREMMPSELRAYAYVLRDRSEKMVVAFIITKRKRFISYSKIKKVLQI